MFALYQWLTTIPVWMFYGLGGLIILESIALLVWSKHAKTKTDSPAKTKLVTKKYFIFMLIVGVCVLSFPTVAQYIDYRIQENMISEKLRELAEADRAAQTQLIKQAQAYNQELGNKSYTQIGDAAGGQASPQSEDYDKYRHLLSENQQDFIGVLSIPALKTRLPIYHGTSPQILEKGVGHLYHTALPVGGKGTHSVLTAHAGLAGKRLFTDLDTLQVGDKWTVTVYQQKFTYQVVSKHTVSPEDLDPIAPQDNKDLMSLITCTPIGINSHRLIVTAKRVENK